ncbi:MAG: rhodanese-like domain-containing protein [Pseudomonadota bacterium]|uniref:rhodanese-like domain-containing protein n=1 Tax=Sphingomonas sp. ERG5 TaxID=1381597 RepID=UPI00054BB03B|nr:rhodanese-like domain-containing protein [Sphingomonas sp. ERG5]
MRTSLIVLMAMAGLSVAMPVTAKEAPAPVNPLIDYDGFVELTRDVRSYRAERLLPVNDFKRHAAAAGALLLDARSAEAFRQGHIAGAVNLPLPDFTAESLARVIGPDVNRPIYIYCNNNFRNNIAPVMTKARPLALNIQTFVNLVGYGYRQVWELGEAVDMNDPAIGWVKG